MKGKVVAVGVLLIITVVIGLYWYQTWLNTVTSYVNNMPVHLLNIEVTPMNIFIDSKVQVKIYLASNASDDTRVILNEERYKFFILSLVKKVEPGTPEYEQQHVRYFSWMAVNDLFSDKKYLSGWSSSFYITKSTPYVFTFDIGKALNDYQGWKEAKGANVTLEGEYELKLEGAVVYTVNNKNEYTIISAMSNPIFVS